MRQVMPVASRLLSPAGDKSAKYGSIPWHAQIAVEEDRRSKTLTHLCSGVIVSNRYVMAQQVPKNIISMGMSILI